MTSFGHSRRNFVGGVGRRARSAHVASATSSASLDAPAAVGVAPAVGCLTVRAPIRSGSTSPRSPGRPLATARQLAARRSRSWSSPTSCILIERVLGFICFFTILFTKQVPEPIFNFRVMAYRYLLARGQLRRIPTQRVPAVLVRDGPDGRRHRRRDPLDGPPRGVQPLGPALQVVPRDPALLRAVLPRDRHALRDRSSRSSRSSSPASTRRRSATSPSACSAGSSGSTRTCT